MDRNWTQYSRIGPFLQKQALKKVMNVFILPWLQPPTHLDQITKQLVVWSNNMKLSLPRDSFSPTNIPILSLVEKFKIYFSNLFFALNINFETCFPKILPNLH
jgi:hypothetical protein